MLQEGDGVFVVMCRAWFSPNIQIVLCHSQRANFVASPKTLPPINLGVLCLWMECGWLRVRFHMTLSEQIFLFTTLPCRHAAVGVWLASNTKLLAQSASPRQV